MQRKEGNNYHGGFWWNSLLGRWSNESTRWYQVAMECKGTNIQAARGVAGRCVINIMNTANITPLPRLASILPSLLMPSLYPHLYQLWVDVWVQIPPSLLPPLRFSKNFTSFVLASATVFCEGIWFDGMFQTLYIVLLCQRWYRNASCSWLRIEYQQRIQWNYSPPLWSSTVGPTFFIVHCMDITGKREYLLPIPSSPWKGNNELPSAQTVSACTISVWIGQEIRILAQQIWTNSEIFPCQWLSPQHFRIRLCIQFKYNWPF